jgi:hypothetical protein
LVHRDDSFLAALAGHAHAAQPHVHIGQSQRPNLTRPQPAQQHQQRYRPIPQGAQIGKESRDVVRPERLGQPTRLAHQTPTTARPAGPDVSEQSALLGAQAAGPAGRRHRVVSPCPDRHRELE